MTILSDFHAKCGATIAAAEPIPISFGNDAVALSAITTGAALVDRTHWGRLMVRGDDRRRFLHNQSTADIEGLKPGMGCETVFINSIGRTIDLALVLALPSEILLMLSPAMRESIFQLLDKYIFFADKVYLQDISAETATFTLIGAGSEQIVQALGGQVDPTAYRHTLVLVEDTNVRVVRDSGLALPGYTLIVEKDRAIMLWQKLTDLGAVPMGERCWEELRIRQGRPAANAELSPEYNPLEVGLWQTISFTKGCYIGQETIARLNTYKGVKQYLWGIKLQQAAAVGSPLSIAGEKVGVLTSYLATAAGHIGLAYVKSKAGGVGLQVQVGETSGEIVDIPYVSHEYYTP